jgi:hypothetical protein
MSFASKEIVDGYEVNTILDFMIGQSEQVTLMQIFFSLPREGSSAVIRSRSTASGKWFELIPHSVLIGDLPDSLVHQHTHWMHKETGDIEFRPLESPWISSDQHWSMRRSVGGEYKACNPTSTIVDIRSLTANMISEAFDSIESLEHMILCTSSYGQLSVNLPRLRLSFHLVGNNLHSQSHPGFLVDSNRGVGTFIGLRSQLVLKPANPVAGAYRRILVPTGEYHMNSNGGHVSVTIDTGLASRVTYQEYEVDTTLRTLVGDGSLLNRLIKIYLHAITSFTLPDPLTGMTGTEMAIMELRSPTCLSFQRLGQPEVDILRKIHGLAPRRAWYPPHLCVMEEVVWSACPSPMAQHDDFALHTEAIIQHANRLELFYGDTAFSDPPPQIYAPLYRRASIRRSYTYIANLHHISTPLSDVPYTTTDRNKPSNSDYASESEVAGLSKMIVWSPSRFPTTPNLLGVLETWDLVQNAADIDMSYSHKWRNPPESAIWLGIYKSCRGMKLSSLAFSLSAMAYTSPRWLPLIPTILAFTKDPSFIQLDVPRWGNPSPYRLSDGFEPATADIISTIKRGACFEGSRFDNLIFTPEESEKSRRRRRQSARDTFFTTLNSQSRLFSDNVMQQWPCENPSMPASLLGSSWLFDAGGVMQSIRRKFCSCYRNLRLSEHLKKVQSQLDAVRINSNALVPASVYVVDPSFSANIRSHNGRYVIPPLMLLSERQAPELPPRPRQLSTDITVLPPAPTSTQDVELKELVASFQDAPTNSLHKRYGRDLEASRCAMLSQLRSIVKETPSEHALQTHLHECSFYFERCLRAIRYQLLPTDGEEQMFAAELWPRLTIKALLGMLSHSTRAALPSEWVESLFTLAYALLKLQRAQRLLSFNRVGDAISLEKELSNPVVEDGQTNCDWLLVQVCGMYRVKCPKPVD